MPDPTPQLRHHEVLRALDGMDPLDVVAQELLRQADDGQQPRTGEPVGVVVSTEVTTIEGPGPEPVCVLPTPSLHMIALAALAALAVRELLTPAVVTAAIFGEGPAAHLHLSLIARFTANFSAATVHPAVLDADQPVTWGVRDELERAGTTLSTSTEPRHAAQGANLLVIAEPGWRRLDLERPRPGVLIINASRRDLPDELLAEVDRVYVDDLALLEHNQHRTFVRWHQAGPGALHDAPQRPAEGWHRHLAPWRHERRIDTDLGDILAGGRTPPVADDVVLVELINGGSLLARLAARVHEVATALGTDS